MAAVRSDPKQNRLSSEKWAEGCAAGAFTFGILALMVGTLAVTLGRGAWLICVLGIPAAGVLALVAGAIAARAEDLGDSSD